jgi:hypothetical protein
MQINELRIGNWVRGENKYKKTEEFIKVESIHYKGINVYDDTEYGHPVIEADYSFEDLQPIPLTSELLEKCGFVLDKGVGVWFDKKENDGFRFTFTLWDSYEGGYLFTREMPSNHIPVFYLHQLQNLYFALTGEELNIEL